MSVRSVRLCDMELCQKPFVTVCALCEKDVCEPHRGNAITLHAMIGTVAIGGVTSVEYICFSCIGRLAALHHDVANDDLARVLPKIRTMLRAAITAQALKG